MSHALRRSGLSLPVVVALSGCGSAPPTLTPDEVVDAFIAITQAPDRSVRMGLFGTFRMGEADPLGNMRFTGTFHMRGADYAGTLESEMAGGNAVPAVPDQRVEVVVVRGRAFTRGPGAAGWAETDMPIPRLDPFTGLTADDVEYVTAQSTDAGQLHQFRVVEPLAALQRSFGQTLGRSLVDQLDPEAASMDVHVNDQGYPVSASLAVRSGGEDDFGFDVQISLRYDFSDWGADIRIVPPTQ